ncbi:MAG: sigma-70 family RNA polymerase sigma factor [Planctomycetota bacterium]|jgi:RNA polymerase sigma-70 factor (ECF subfamily)
MSDMENEHPALTPEALLGEADFIRSVARRLVYDPSHAEDVAQEAWVAALRRPPAGVTSLRGWLTAVVRNLARRRHRTEQRRLAREAATAAPAAVPGPAEVAQREELRARVVEAVLALEPTYRDVVLLRDYEGLPPRDIAQRLGITPGAVSTRLTRAHAKLREQLDAQHGGDGRAWVLALLALVGFTGSAHAADSAPPSARGGSAMPVAMKAAMVCGVVAVVGVGGSMLWGGGAEPRSNGALQRGGAVGQANSQPAPSAPTPAPGSALPPAGEEHAAAGGAAAEPIPAAVPPAPQAGHRLTVELTGLRPGEAAPFRIEAWDGGGMRLSKGLTFNEDNRFLVRGEGGANGRIELDVTPLFRKSWPYWLRVRLAHPGYMPVLTEFRIRPEPDDGGEGGGFGVAADDEDEAEERAPASGHYTHAVEVVPAFTLTGAVRCADGSAPDRKVQVAAFPLGPDGPEARTIHDPARLPAGPFALQVPEHPDYYVVAAVNGYLPVGVELRGAHATARVPELLLERGVSIAGVVTAPTGDPLRNASVRVVPPAPEGARRTIELPLGGSTLRLCDGVLHATVAWGRSDAAGRFSVFGLRPGSHEVHVTEVMSRLLTQTIRDVRAPGDGVRAVLPGCRVSVALDPAPAPGVYTTVLLVRYGPGKDGPRTMLKGSGQWSTKEAEWRSPWKVPGTYALKISRPGFRTVERDLGELKAGDDRRERFTLERE